MLIGSSHSIFSGLIARERDRLAVTEVLHLLNGKGHWADASLSVSTHRIIICAYHAPLHHHIVGAIRHVGHYVIVAVRGKSCRQNIETASRGWCHAYARSSADVTAGAVSVRRTLDRGWYGHTRSYVAEECIAHLLYSLVINNAVGWAHWKAGLSGDDIPVPVECRINIDTDHDPDISSRIIHCCRKLGRGE